MDWVVALILGVIVVGAVFAIPVLMAALSALLAPVLLLGAVTLGIWFLRQILREGGDHGNYPRGGRGPDP
jgi:hypothetical protein